MQDHTITTKLILLYGTSECHLCEEAIDVLNDNHIPYEFIDIVHDNNLMNQLGWFIPVIEYQNLLIKSPIPWDEILTKLKESLIYSQP